MTTAATSGYDPMKWNFDEIDRVDAADRPWHSIGFQTKLVSGLGLFYLFGAGMFFLADGEIALAGRIFSFIIAGMAFFMALILGGLALLWGRRLQRMVDGHTDADWRIDERRWHAYLDREQSAARWVPWACLGFALFFAGCVGFGMGQNPQVGGDQPFATGLLITTLGTLYLAPIPLGIAWAGRRLMIRKREGSRRVLIGESGFYLAGSFWPWRTVGQRVVAGRLETQADANDAPAALLPRLVFTVETQNKYGTNRRPVYAPVPTDAVEQARQVLRVHGM